MQVGNIRNAKGSLGDLVTGIERSRRRRATEEATKTEKKEEEENRGGWLAEEWQ